MTDETLSVRSSKVKSVFAKFNNTQNKNKRLGYITEFDLFKLASINLPRHTLMQSMPASLQMESTEINRMRSHYIKMALYVWRSYTKHVFGTTCPIFGTYTSEGIIYPS